MRLISRFPALPWLAAALLLAGCTPTVSLRRIDDEAWFARESRTALQSKEPSERTRQYLRRESLLGPYYEDSEAVLLRLHEQLVTRRERVVALHLAELCYLHAKQRSRTSEEVVRHHLSAARYAYAYLFDADLAPPSRGYDPGFRWACDFYNRSLAAVVRRMSSRTVLQDGRAQLPLLVGTLELSAGSSEFGWDRSIYSEIRIAFDYDVVGLAGLARSFGLGVPVILVRRVADDEESFRPALLDAMTSGRPAAIPVHQSYGATIFLRPTRTLCEEAATGAAPAATLEVYDPTRTESVRVGDADVTLEQDLTTPLAFSLARSHPAGGLSAFFDVDESISQVGLEMFQRYDPDKIPVILVHGLLSSPETWMHLFNDLLADRELRHRFQFWFFRYPTGNPIPLSAALLRQTLLEVARRADPERKNPEFQDAVIVGHSMGGLLTKLQVLDGGDRAWQLISDRPLEELELPEEQRQLMRGIAFFERLPFVTRVVFMATPHRGAGMATSWYANLGQKLVTLPQTVYTTSKALVELAGQRLRGKPGSTPMSLGITGLSGLSPDSPLSRVVVLWPFPPDLPIHSIIGNVQAADTPGGSDGLVAYESSHLDGVVSELIVKSGHNVQEHAPAVQELIRILRLHLAEHDARLAREAAASTPPAAPAPPGK